MVNWKNVVAAMFLLPIILMIASLFGPWYYYSAQGGSGLFSAEFNQNYYFDRIKFEGNLGAGLNIFVGSGNFDLTLYYSDEIFKEKNNLESVMETTQILTVLGFIFSIIGFIGMVLYTKMNSFKLAFLLGLIALIIIILPALYFMSVFPGAIAEDKLLNVPNQEHDFFGSQEFMGVKQSWGGSWGWLAALSAWIFCLVGFILLIFHKILAHPIGRTNGKNKPKIKRRWI